MQTILEVHKDNKQLQRTAQRNQETISEYHDQQEINHLNIQLKNPH